MSGRWTIVSLQDRGRFARPIAGAPVGEWQDARNAAYAMPDTPGIEVWYVPAQGEATYPEDRDNILVAGNKRTRRVPIRWDSAPQLTYPAG